MKLLLVDDEPYTREGILSMISFKELGIDTVITAQDGVEGLETALSIFPDIILTDVKMPRLDGVSMSFQIREHMPDCSIIFMSGYADKEYLKSAIRLSAINYIEKPFLPSELLSTLKIAVEKCQEVASRRKSTDEMTHKLELSIPAIKNKIALDILQPTGISQELDEHLLMAWPNFTKEGPWITFLVFLLDHTEENPYYQTSIQDAIRDLLESRLMLCDFANVIVGVKSGQVIVVHMNLRDRNGNPIPNSEIGNICYMLCDILKSTCRFLLATGYPIERFENIYESYQAASICLQRGFFHKENAVLFYEEKHTHLVYQFGNDSLQPFEQALGQHDESASLLFVKNLVEKLRRFDGTLVSSVKSFFYQMLKVLYDTAVLCGSSAFTKQDTPESLSDLLWNMAFLSDIEKYITEKLDAFFRTSDDKYTQYPIAYQIRRYIDENYENEDTSLSDIAQEFSVSESYICIVFKKVFDDTVNQYMIEKRINKAKEYLKNTNKKIKEISELVGYRDSNYFIRIFKKTTGMTPADYRLKLYSGNALI